MSYNQFTAQWMCHSKSIDVYLDEKIKVLFEGVNNCNLIYAFVVKLSVQVKYPLSALLKVHMLSID